MAERISREFDGVKYVGACETNGLFMPGMLFCTSCGNRVNPHAMEGDISLTCSGCGRRIKVFSSEDEMNEYLSREWTLLEKMCESRARR